tara:strand:+ start:247 stop:423 length:177 start_codon:yes stop_codon:yes gene_type:complete
MSDYTNIKPYVSGIVNGPWQMKLAGAAALATVLGAPVVASKLSKQYRKAQRKISDAIN